MNGVGTPFYAENVALPSGPRIPPPPTRSAVFQGRAGLAKY